MWKGKVLISTGNVVDGKKHLTQAMQFDPDLKECKDYIKILKQAAQSKE